MVARRTTARQAVLTAVGLVALGISALAPVSPAKAQFACGIDRAAGKPAPPPAKTDNPNHFRIVWHISTQIEDLADAKASAKAMADIGEARKLVDGYFVNVLMGGPLIYWPGRPKACAVNFYRTEAGQRIEVEGEVVTFKKGGVDERDACLAEQDRFLAGQPASRDTAGEIQSQALDRVFANIGLAEEQARGKEVWGVDVIRNVDFTYDQQTDRLTMTRLPRSYCGITALGVTPSDMMVYQEAAVQTRQGRHLWLPRKSRNGSLVFSKNPGRDRMPDNPHAVELVSAAFRQSGLPPTALHVNVRRMSTALAPRILGQLEQIPGIAGVNFEGGPAILHDGKDTLDNYVENMSWVLANTGLEMSILMPGYRPLDQVGNEAEIDARLPELRKMLKDINARLSAKLALPKGKNALCTSRIALIPASYGRPIHVKALPMRRSNGKLAGTVTGQIRMLADLQSELCGR